MPETTRGIVLNTQNYSETSLITRIYTLDFGMQSYIVKGAKRKNSRINPALLQAPTLVELVASHNNTGKLHHLRSVSCDPLFTTIASNPNKRTLAVFLSDLLYRCIKEEEANTNLFNFIDTSFQLFDNMTNSCRHFHLYFMLQLSKYLGFYPGNLPFGENIYFDITEGRFTNNQSDTNMIAGEAVSAFISTILKKGMNDPSDLSIESADEKMIFDTIITYYEYHHMHGQRIKSRYLIDEVLN